MGGGEAWVAGGSPDDAIVDGGRRCDADLFFLTTAREILDFFADFFTFITRTPRQARGANIILVPDRQEDSCTPNYDETWYITLPAHLG